MPARTYYKTHGQPRTVPVCKYSPKMSACGSRTCNFDAASSFTGWMFASVAKVTGALVCASWCRSAWPSYWGNSEPIMCKRTVCYTSCYWLSWQRPGELWLGILGSVSQFLTNYVWYELLTNLHSKLCSTVQKVLLHTDRNKWDTCTDEQH